MSEKLVWKNLEFSTADAEMLKFLFLTEQLFCLNFQIGKVKSFK
jgi:hypothetical protein